MHSILIVEDDDSIRSLLSERLRDYETQMAPDLTAAKNILRSCNFDLILLDAELPDGCGFSFCAELKKNSKYAQIPIIFLTAKNKTIDKVTGLSIGAEDYVTKPFDPLELRARIEARLRSTSAEKINQRHFHIQDLKFDLLAGTVHIVSGDNAERLDLTPIEFKILLFFSRHFREILNRERIITNIWPELTEITDRTIDSHLSNLRKKIRKSTVSINSVYGEGYILEEKNSRLNSTA